MCDYCGCLGNTFIAELTDEHEAIAAVAGEVAAAHAADDRPVVRSAVARLIDMLYPHTQREEGVLFPELAAAGVGAHTDVLEAEHDALDRGFAAVLAGQDGAWEALPEVLVLLRTHIWREDYDVFPAALQLLDPAAWTRVADGAAAAAT